MAEGWFYKSEITEEKGPFTAAELKELASEGRIIPSTMIRRGDDGTWVIASQVKGLFEQGSAQSISTPSAPLATTVPPHLEFPVQTETFTSPTSRISSMSSTETSLNPMAVPQKQGLPPAILIAIGAGGTLMAVAIIALVMMINRGPHGTRKSPTIAGGTPTPAPTVPHTEAGNTATATQKVIPSFRKEIFEKAHRAAVEYSPGKNVRLAKELELIESSIQGENEQEVFKLFKVVMEIQTDLNILEVGKLVTDKTAKDFKAVTPSTKQITASIGGAAKDRYEELATTAAISQAGGVAVSSKISADFEKTMKLLLDRQSITPFERDGVRWIPYESMQSELRIMEKATLKVAVEALNNGGKTLKDSL